MPHSHSRTATSITTRSYALACNTIASWADIPHGFRGKRRILAGEGLDHLGCYEEPGLSFQRMGSCRPWEKRPPRNSVRWSALRKPTKRDHADAIVKRCDARRRMCWQSDKFTCADRSVTKQQTVAPKILVIVQLLQQLFQQTLRRDQPQRKLC